MLQKYQIACSLDMFRLSFEIRSACVELSKPGNGAHGALCAPFPELCGSRCGRWGHPTCIKNASPFCFRGYESIVLGGGHAASSIRKCWNYAMQKPSRLLKAPMRKPSLSVWAARANRKCKSTHCNALFFSYFILGIACSVQKADSTRCWQQIMLRSITFLPNTPWNNGKGESFLEV